MNKILKLTIVASAIMTMAACSDENAEIDYKDLSDYFMPAQDANDEISQMRRQFKEEEGSYLLFNDTLQHYPIGTDINGKQQYFTELLDINYKVGGQLHSSGYTYTYLTTTEQCTNAIEYLKGYILSHLSEQLRPFSWFIAGTITGQSTSGGKIKPYTVSGERCIAIACDQLKSLKTEAQKTQLASRHLLSIVGTLATNNASTFSDFTSVVSEYYQKDLNKPDGVNTNDYVRSYGFANSTSVSTFPSQENDFNAFATIVITYTMEQIEKTYAKYPLIIQRAKLFRNDLIKLGYKF